MFKPAASALGSFKTHFSCTNYHKFVFTCSFYSLKCNTCHNLEKGIMPVKDYSIFVHTAVLKDPGSYREFSLNYSIG